MCPQAVAVDHIVDGDVGLLGLSGQLTREAVPLVLHALAEVLESGVTCVQVGLAGVTFMDSSGLTLLLRIRERLGPTKVDMVLVAPSAQALKVLEATHLVGVFEITPG